MRAMAKSRTGTWGRGRDIGDAALPCLTTTSHFSPPILVLGLPIKRSTWPL